MKVHHQQFNYLGAARNHRRSMTTLGHNTRLIKAGKSKKGWFLVWSPGYIDLPSLS